MVNTTYAAVGQRFPFNKIYLILSYLKMTVSLNYIYYIPTNIIILLRRLKTI